MRHLGLTLIAAMWLTGLGLPAWALKVCPECRAEFPDQTRFCPNDGRPLKAEKKADPGTLELKLTPKEAVATIDGLTQFKGPDVKAELPGGSHLIEVKAPGFSPQRITISLEPGHQETLAMDLLPLPSAEPRVASEPVEIKSSVLPVQLANAPATPDFTNMVQIRPGTYQLGSERGNPDERPLRRIKTNGFYIDRTEVTCRDYARFLEAVRRDGHRWCHPLEPNNKDHTPFHTYAWALRFSWVAGNPPSGMEDNPVVLVDWFDAFAYASWAGKRLPTEDEWEICAGAGDGRDYPWGNTFSIDRLNVGDYPVKVGMFPTGASPWGILDMAGNVAEWTGSMYEPDARDSKLFTGHFGQPLIRGGSWDDESKSCRVSARDVHRSPMYRSTTVGFRCAADLK